MSTRRSFSAGVSLVLAPMPVAVGQSSVAVSPFVSYVPSAAQNPLAGLALTFGGTTGLALRGSADLSISNPNKADSAASVGRYRPWGGDADAILFLGGLGGGATVFSRSLSPYLFSGIGLTGGDSAGQNVVHNGWSYGAGATIPLGLDADVFAEARWRMSQYVLPTAHLAPSPTSEFRFGLSFHVGGGGSSSEPTPSRRRRHRERDDDDDDDASASTASGAAAAATATAISVSLPGSIIYSRGSHRRVRPGVSVTVMRTRVVLPTADHYLGVRYRYGGTSPVTGFDCSGFTQYIFSRHGVRLPRTARDQALVGTSLGRDWGALEAGDLVMFSDDDDGRISHVAIYAGNNRIIHSTSTGGGVRYDDLSTTRGAWFREHMVLARRVTPDARGVMLDLARGFSEVAAAFDRPDRAPSPP